MWPPWGFLGQSSLSLQAWVPGSALQLFFPVEGRAGWWEWKGLGRPGLEWTGGPGSFSGGFQAACEQESTVSELSEAGGLPICGYTITCYI